MDGSAREADRGPNQTGGIADSFIPPWQVGSVMPRLMRNQHTLVHADTDEMFIEIRFDEEYRKAKSSIISDRCAWRSGRCEIRPDRRTYSGTVTAYSTASGSNSRLGCSLSDQ
jgi:hypothetical protein